MAVRNFAKDNTVGTDTQPAAVALALAAGDTTNVIQVPLGLSRMRVYAGGAATFSVDVKASPINNPAGLVILGTLTQAAPSVVFEGPIGAILRLDVTAAAAPVNVGVMGIKEN